jgi:hypothetical protein
MLSKIKYKASEDEDQARDSGWGLAGVRVYQESIQLSGAYATRQTS